jgi:hypothetical protein
MDADVLWKTLPSPINPRRDGVATVLRTTDGASVGIMLVGGRDPISDNAVATTELLEWKLYEWWSLPNLSCARSECAVTTLLDTVYVVGGVDSAGQVLDSVECWTLSCPESFWQTVTAPMSTPRWGCAVVGMSRLGLLVVIGGRNASWQSLTSVEAYDVQQQRWKTLHSLATPRFGCAAIAIGPSRIMIMGGYDGQRILSSCRAYNMEEDEWTDLPNMPLPCVFGSATVLARDSRFVFVMGKTVLGDNEMDNVNGPGLSSFATHANKVIQCYCVKSRKWSILTTNETIESGYLMSIGEELIAIGGQPRPMTPPSSEQASRNQAVMRLMGPNYRTMKPICRRYNMVDTDLTFDENNPSVDSIRSGGNRDWRHRNHHSTGDFSSLSPNKHPAATSPHSATPSGNRAIMRATTMPYLPSMTPNTNAGLENVVATSVAPVGSGSGVYFPPEWS